MFLREDQLTTLETPCLVIDMDLARKNCEEMKAEADRNHCKLRPHVKTHKMPRFAQMQLEAGASGITCCKVSEAEIMAKAGFRIFLSPIRWLVAQEWNGLWPCKSRCGG